MRRFDTEICAGPMKRDRTSTIGVRLDEAEARFLQQAACGLPVTEPYVLASMRPPSVSRSAREGSA